jgi:Stage II sporulation protein
MPGDLSRRELLLATASQYLRAAATANRYTFSVLSLLRPTQLNLKAAGESRLHCVSAKGESILEPGYVQSIVPEMVPFHAAGPDGTPVQFRLAVPGVLSRRFQGTLQVFASGGVLVPVVTMTCADAVSSIVAAELPVLRSPKQALMAQAVVARSFVEGMSTARHDRAFFCDTTHCQFLRSPALTGSPVALAVAETHAAVLTSNSSVIAASYSAACGGWTEAGLRDGYRYHAVRCTVCRELGLKRRGHGWGLCQEGALGLASRGLTWQEILREYYPGAGQATA